MNSFYHELPNHPLLEPLIPEIKDLYLLLYSSNKEFLKTVDYNFVDDVNGDEYNIVFDITKIPENRYPKIHNFKNNTPLGALMKHGAFFTETDTRKEITTRHKQLDIHSHVEPVLINFPLINCNSDSQIHFYDSADFKDVSLSKFGGVYVPKNSEYKPIASYSSKDNIPILLHSREYHSVTNNGNVRRIVFSWYMQHNVTWEEAIAASVAGYNH